MADVVEIIFRSKDEASANAQKVEKSVSSVGSKAKEFGIGLAAVGGGLGLFVKGALEGAGKAEQLQVSFTTMIGDADKAKASLASLTNFAAKTPFQLPEVQDAAKKLLAFGTAAEDLEPTLKSLGDVSSIIQAPISEIAEIYGKIRVQGRLFGEDINQLQGRGIPVVQELAKQFGVSNTEIRKMVEEGKIGFPEIEKAFKSMSSEGGFAFNAMENQSKTFLGSISNIQDSAGQLMVTFGQALMPAAEAVAKVIGDVVSALGKMSPETKQALAEGVALAAGLGGLAAAFLFLASPIGMITVAVGAAIAIYVALKSNGELLAIQMGIMGREIEKIWKEIQLAAVGMAAGVLEAFAQIPGPTQESFRQAAEGARSIQQQLQNDLHRINSEITSEHQKELEIQKTNLENNLAERLDKITKMSGEEKEAALREYEALRTEGIAKFGDLMLGTTENLQKMRDAAAARSAEIKQQFIANISAAASGALSALQSQVPGFQKVYDNIKGIFKSHSFTINAVVNAGSTLAGAYTGNVFKNKASGGGVSAGHPYVVGENGPEIFNPSNAGSIIPNHKVKGGGTTIINQFNGPVSSKEVAEQYADMTVRKLQLSNMVF